MTMIITELNLQNDFLPPASFLRMVTLGLVLVSPSFLYGLNLAYPTVALPQMGFNLNDASWFGSVAVYMSPISSILVGFIIDSLGRRTTLLFSIVPSIVGWLLLYWSPNVTVTLTGQMLNGLTVGSVFYPVQVYAGECVMVDSVRLRNSFLTWIGFSSSLGTTSMLLMANFLDYRRICVVSLALCVAMFATFAAVIPESPLWLYNRGRLADAFDAERKLGIRQPILHGSGATTSDRVAGHRQPKSESNWSTNLVAGLRKIRRPDVYKPLTILSVTGILLPFAGLMTSTTYMINIIDGHVPGLPTNVSVTLVPRAAAAAAAAATATPTAAVDGGALNVVDFQSVPDAFANRTIANATPFVASAAYKYSLISGLFMCAGSLVSGLLLPHFGIRKLISVSNLCSVVGLLALAYAHDAPRPAASAMWTRIVAITWLAFLLGVILGPTCASTGDIFPADAKGFASLVDIFANVSAATANKVYPYLCVWLDAYAYTVYAGVSVIGAGCVYWFAPEVVGKTLDEINREFWSSKKKGRR